MKIVIATGCPDSGWEGVVPTLLRAGLERVGDGLAEWTQQVLAASGVDDPLQLRQNLKPGSRMEEMLASLLSQQQPVEACHADSRSLWLLDFWAMQLPDARFLLLFTGAETAVARALMCGIDPVRFLDGWKAANRHLMRFQGRHRRRALLLNAEVASRHPDELIAATQRLGLSLQVDAEGDRPDGFVVPALERFLAKRLIADDPSISVLEMELEARAQPLGEAANHDPEVALDELVQGYLHTRHHHQQVWSQLHVAQEELERTAVEKQQVEQAQQAASAALQQLQARMAQAEKIGKNLEATNRSLEAARKETLAKNESLLTQLAQTQEDLKTAVAQKDAIDQTQKATAVELQQIRARMVQAEQACQRLEATKQSLEASSKETLGENELLLAQLHEVQEELEKLFLEKEQLEQAGKVTATELQQLKARMAQAEEARKKLEAANHSLEAARKEALANAERHLKTLGQVQNELKSVVAQKQEVDQTLRASGAELQQLKARMAQAEEARKKLEAANHSLEAARKEALANTERHLKKLGQAQNELKSVVAQKQEVDQTLRASGAEVQELKARLAQAEQAGQELEGANQLLVTSRKEALEENELLLKQLHEVQEELEAYYLRYQEALSRQPPVKEEPATVLEASPVGEVEPQPIAQQDKAAASTTQTFLRRLVRPFKRPDKKKERLRRQVDVLKQSGLFDPQWYLSHYPDVASAGVDPVEHYLRFGAAEGRNPSPRFDTRYYLHSNPDVAAAGVNPLLHYIQFGVSEGRQACG
jgi:hypothetical protein